MGAFVLGFVAGMAVTAGIAMVCGAYRSRFPRSYHEMLVGDAGIMHREARRFLEESKALQAELQSTLKLAQQEMGAGRGGYCDGTF